MTDTRSPKRLRWHCARLTDAEAATLDALCLATGLTRSAVLRRGLEAVAAELERERAPA